MFAKSVAFGALVGIGALLVGCGGDNSSPVSSSVLQTGTVVDSNISGLIYECRKSDGTADTNGSTDSAGKFQYSIGSNCTFKVGGLLIGTVSMTQANKVVTPLDMMKSSDINDTNVTNLALFFQSLDEDGNASNGIQLAHAKSLFSGTPSFDFNAADENTTYDFVKGVFSGAKKLSGSEARQHFNDTLNLLGLAGGNGIGDNNSSDGNMTTGEDNNATNNNSGGSSELTFSKIIGNTTTYSLSAATMTTFTGGKNIKWGDTSTLAVVVSYSKTDAITGGVFESLNVNMAKISPLLSTWINNTSAGTCTLPGTTASETYTKYYKPCSDFGITFDSTKGIITFQSTEMIDKVGENGTFTVTGSLNFTSF